MTKIPNGEVSATKFNTAFGRAGCGLKFYYRYVEGIRGPVKSSLLAGIAFDEATRALHDERIAQNTSDTTPAEVFIDRWENPPEKNKDGEIVDYDLSEAPVDIIERGLNALAQYENATIDMRPVSTQVLVRTGFEETDAELIGFVDLIEKDANGNSVVTDVKTSLSARKKWSLSDAARDSQLAIYSVLVNATNVDSIVSAVGWRFARLGGKVEVGAIHVSAPNPASIMQRVSYWMGELERWCETGDFPPTGLDKDAWVCSEKYCDYYHRCPHGAKAQTIIPITISGKN